MSLLAVLKKHKRITGALFIALVLLLAYFFNLFSYPEYKLQDALYQKPRIIDAPEIYIIGIDEKALVQFGRFRDWNRNIIADAISILNTDEQYRPAVIAIDILFTEESNDPAADAALAQAAKSGGNVVLASQAVVGRDMALHSIIMDVEEPYAPLGDYARHGIVNAIHDSDGIIRRCTLKAPWDGGYVNGFAYEVFKAYTGEELKFAEDNHIAGIAYTDKPGGYFAMSLADVFKPDFEPDFFADAIVFIGAYAPGMMDAYYTPIDSSTQMHGVEIHANAVQMLLDGNFKTEILPSVNLLILLMFIAFAIVMGGRADIRVCLAATVIAGALYTFGAVWLYSIGYIAALLYPLLTITVMYLYHLVYGYISETIEKREIKRVFKKYADPGLVDKLINTGEADSNEAGVKKHIAVLFVDVRKFTPMSEALRSNPEIIVRILNEYLELTSNAVFSNGGSIDKFIGDATMALFNGFVQLDDYVFKAVKAARDMVQASAAMNTSIKEKYGVDVGFGIGIHCGEAIVGNLGPSFRKDYTAIGDTVNTAARLESNAQTGQILLSEPVYHALEGRINARCIGDIRLKGKSGKMTVYELEGIT